MLGGWGKLVVPTLLWLAIWGLFPEHDETHALFDDGPSQLHYLIPFGIGWLLRVRPELFAAVARCWRVGLVVGMAAFAFVAWVEGTWPGDTPAPDGVAAWFAAARLVQGWATMVALVGIADAWGNRDHRRSEEHTSELQSLMRI